MRTRQLLAAALAGVALLCPAVAAQKYGFPGAGAGAGFWEVLNRVSN